MSFRLERVLGTSLIMSTLICDSVSFAKSVLLRQFSNVCGYRIRRSNIIDDTCGYGIHHSNIIDDTCGYAVPRSNIVLKLALFIGTVFTLINIGRKIKSLRNETTEMRPSTQEDVSEEENDNNNAASTLKEFYERKFDNLGMEIQLLQSENSRLRATLMEKENLFDQMAADIDGLRRRVIDNFKGKMEERSPLPSGSFQEEEDDFLDLLGQTMNDLNENDFPKPSLLEDCRRNNIYESVLTLRRRMDALDQENHQLKKENTEREQKIDDLERKVLGFVKENENIKTEFEKEVNGLKHRLSSQQDMSREKDVQVERFKKEVTEKEERIEDLEKEVQKLADEKNAVKNEWESKVRHLMQELSQLHLRKDRQIANV
ncbi:uncharacterized protein [Macrobrachium rosenbergii]|uniref:uncharacterized protein n=1 Tax=Macrobrachium rosenbergii TaxID=79674 RepID=UPI0034D49D61